MAIMASGASGAVGMQDAQAERTERRVARAQLSFKQWIENKAATPASIVLIVALVLRSAQAWSFGAFSLSMLPHPLQLLFDALTGIGAALSMELLMSAAGAQWMKLRSDRVMVQFDTSKPKRQRDAEASLIEERAALYLGFTALGAVASVTGSVYFAVTATHANSIGVIIADVALALVITAGVFFFGVVYEPSRPDATQQAQESIEDRLNDVTLDMAGQIATGDVRAEHIAFLKGRVSPTYARQLDALMPRDNTLDWWDTPRIATWLGDTSDAAQRAIRRKLAQARTQPALGVRNKENGRGLECPESALFTIFQSDIEKAMRAGSLRAMNGEPAAQASDAQSDAPRGAGQPAGRARRVSAPRQARGGDGADGMTPGWAQVLLDHTAPVASTVAE